MTLQNKIIALSDDATHRNKAQPNHAPDSQDRATTDLAQFSVNVATTRSPYPAHL